MITTPRGELLAYSLNLFPSETVAEVEAACLGPMRRVREHLDRADEETLGVELRFGRPAIAELSENPEALSRFRGMLERERLDPFTLNGFPVGRFHADRVKEDVFRPTWLDEERVELTERLGRIAAGLLEEGRRGTVSTSTGSFKPWGHGDRVLDAIARNLARAAGGFAALRERTGVRLRLCVEPEPLNSVENLGETLDLFARLERVGADEIVRRFRTTEDEARAIIRDHLGVNYDTCHFSVQFEEPAATLSSLEAAGIHIGKIHLSNCVTLLDPANNAEGLETLASLDEPRYLHQVVGVDPSGEITLRDADVPDFLARSREELEALAEVRVHFHVPLFFEGGGGIGTTAVDTESAYRFARARGLTEQYAVETYTFGTLLDAGRIDVEDLPAGIARELRWVEARREESP